MPPVQQSQPGIKDIDFSHYISHYAALLWRWKWWMLIATPFAVGAALFIFMKFSDATPELPATALIGMEPIAGMIDASVAVLKSKGLPEELIFYDKFA